MTQQKNQTEKIQRHLKQMKMTTVVLFWLTLALGIIDIVYISVFEHQTWEEIIFRAMQYVGMILILAAPLLLKRFQITVPITLSVLIGLFSFGALVLGDGLDLYGRFTWWDSLLHAFSGVLLSYIALWLIHLIMARNSKYIFLNKYFLALFLVCFSVALGAMWEIIEYTYDSIMGTNTQQFMATTTGSIYSDSDIPYYGHEALKDTMTDLILDFVGSMIVAIYSIIRHDDLKKNYSLIQQILKSN